MPTLTRNLFHGRGAVDTRLEVVEGHWPDDMSGDVFVVGPDKRRPGGHWFAERGMVLRIGTRLDAGGRLPVRSRLVRTPVLKLRDRLPFLFHSVAFADVSPFGSTNLANTNVEPVAGRLFLGYDAGRQIEIDPDTLEVLTPVGGNDEWFQALPGFLEPMVAVAAHPGADHPATDDDRAAMWFINYSPVPSADGTPTVFLARWDMENGIERWPLSGLPEFDTVHDIKASGDHLVFTDLPFAVGPETFMGKPRTTPNADVTQLFVISKAAVAATPPGEPVPVTTVRIPMPTGHVMVDRDLVDGKLRVVLEHIPLADLMIPLREGAATYSGGTVESDYEGLVTLGVQPGVVGRYLVDPDTGEVEEADVAWDDRFWGSVLATRDLSTPEARARGRELWFGGVGFDPDLVPQEWWDLYGDGALAHVVHPEDLPGDGRPGALAHFDLETMKVTEVHAFADGAFPSPPQFVPRVDADGPGDGYVLVMVHRDGPKAIAVFDAAHIDEGPLAVASSPAFNPPLLLHSCWLGPDRPARPDYKVPLRRDLAGSWRQLPAQLRSMAATGRQMAAQFRSSRA